jgi:glycosyltransferase involved in cell wall biosynthesis
VQRRPLEIGFVSIWYVRGITMVARQLAAALESDAFRTHVFARWESDRFFAGPPVTHPRVFNAGEDPDPAVIIAWARERRLDAIVFCEIHPNDWRRVVALREAGVPVFAWETLDLLRQEMIPRYRDLEGMIHGTFHGAQVFRELHPDLRAVIVPWAIPPASLPPRRAPAGDRRLRFVHVGGWGGLSNRKNTDGVLRAWRRTAPRGAVLVLHSQVSLDRYGTELADFGRRGAGIVLHEGTVEHIFDVYADADLLLWPSRRDGVGLPVVEALACGVPVLVSDGYEMKQWLVPGEHGVVCPAREARDGMYLPLVEPDEDALAETIAGLAESEDLVAAMAEHVRRDQAIWWWTWQPEVLRAQLRAMIEEPGYAPDPRATYLPADILAFEQRRREAFGEDGWGIPASASA